MQLTTMSTSESKRLIDEKDDHKVFKCTLNIEVFRFVAFVNILSLFAVGKIVSDLYVFAPEVPGTTILGMVPTGTHDVTDTKIYQMFGFNHLCNVVDFNPSKEIAAIMVFFHVFPMNCFLCLSHMRTYLAYKNKEVPKWLLTYSTFSTPFCIIATGLIHLWFVNGPQMEYPDGYGFIGHYLPYMGFQISLGLVAIQQLHYYIAIDKIPFGISPALATFYVRFVIVVTLLCQLCVLSIMMGHPILDSKAGGVEGTWERKAFVILGDVYAFTGLIGPLVFSFADMRNGDTNTITFEHQ